MTWSGFNRAFFLRFPEMEKLALEMFAYFEEDEPGRYLIFEDIFVPMIVTAARNQAVATLTDYLGFVEEIATSDESLVYVGLGEHLVTNDVRPIIYSLAGPRTRRELDEAERAYINHLRKKESMPLSNLTRKLFQRHKDFS